MTIASSMDSDTLLTMRRGRAMSVVLLFVPRRLQPLALLLREDWKTNFCDWTLPGFRAAAVHRLGVWVQEESGRGFVRGPIKFVLRRFHLMMFRYVRNHYGIEVPSTVVLGRRVILGHQSGIVIHPRARIGDDCIIRQNVTIGALNTERSEEAPVIGDRVELGTGVAIVGPVTIGDGSRIGPHCVIMTDVPPGSTVFVNPPRMITLRSATPADSANTARQGQPAGAAQ
jgi:serine O-acetyltransferase